MQRPVLCVDEVEDSAEEDGVGGGSGGGSEVPVDTASALPLSLVSAVSDQCGSAADSGGGSGV